MKIGIKIWKTPDFGIIKGYHSFHIFIYKVHIRIGIN